MKRTEDREIDDKRSASIGTQVASVALIALSLADPPSPGPRPASQKAVARFGSKAAIRKKSAPTEAPAPQPDPPAIPSENLPVHATRPERMNLSSSQARPWPMIRFAGAVRAWAADVAQAPGRVAFAPPLAGLAFGAVAHPAVGLLPAELIFKGARRCRSRPSQTSRPSAERHRPLRPAYKAPSQCRSRSPRRAGRAPYAQA